LVRQVIIAVVIAASFILCIAGARAETGIASITLKPGRTASGARFDPTAMTAAHRFLPFGTKVRVTRGARAVVVTINDRGPFIRGRIIDLTPAAARALGMGRSMGLARVSIERNTVTRAVINGSTTAPAPLQSGIDPAPALRTEAGIRASIAALAAYNARALDFEAMRAARDHHRALFQPGARKSARERRIGWPRVLPGTVSPAPAPIGQADGTTILKRADDDEYLCAVYQRQPIKADRSGDFTWKDIFAARRLGKSVCDYVVGGMAPKFKTALAAAGREMDRQGIRWSILSGFRDDYRQRIAAGFKARVGNSLHGGSRVTCGYGCGRAADISDGDGGISKASGWLAVNGHRWGLRRPMPGIDPAHVQMGGQRYAQRWKKRRRWRLALR